MREFFYPYDQIASLLSLEAIVVHESLPTKFSPNFPEEMNFLQKRWSLLRSSLVSMNDETLHQWWRNYTLYSKSPLQRNALRVKSSLVNNMRWMGKLRLTPIGVKSPFHSVGEYLLSVAGATHCPSCCFAATTVFVKPIECSSTLPLL